MTDQTSPLKQRDEIQNISGSVPITISRNGNRNFVSAVLNLLKPRGNQKTWGTKKKIQTSFLMPTPPIFSANKQTSKQGKNAYKIFCDD